MFLDKTNSSKPLQGIKVLELSRRLSVSACGFLLAELGAEVSYLEDLSILNDFKNPVEKRLRLHGKYPTQYLSNPSGSYFKPFRVIIYSEFDQGSPILEDLAQYIPTRESNQIICSISSQGQGWPNFSEDLSDAFMQAISGLMAVSGLPNGRPEFTKLPITELCTAVISSYSILTSIYSNSNQLIDLSILEIMADQLRTHISLIPLNQNATYRLGCGHPLCSPWDVYLANDGWVIICASSDAHWVGLLQLMDKSELLSDPRFQNVGQRRSNKTEVDSLVNKWTKDLSVHQVVDELKKIGIPSGPALSPQEVPLDKELVNAGIVISEEGYSYSRTPIQISESATYFESNQPKIVSKLPLDGIKVVEFTAYAAGPLTGFLLASLGAEVIKIEPKNGEEGRKFKPQFDGISGYYINYNAGKKSIAVDLQDADSKNKVLGLIESADIVLHNMRPGAMEKLGFGVDDLHKINPGLIYCSISGYGLKGPKLAALDTMIQGHLGITGIYSGLNLPIRIGYSIADQLSAHFASASIVAALINRDKTHKGQIVDVAMADAIAWLTQLDWNNFASTNKTFQLQARDGWVITNQDIEGNYDHMDRYELTQYLKSINAAATPVLEINEVINQQSLIDRKFKYQIKMQNSEMADLISPPLGVPVFEPTDFFTLGMHNYLIENL